jgi:Transcriptional regulator
MTLRHFQIFVAVCGSMNMTAAAGVLFMSQPAVSQAISELEGYYGVRLFERLSKKLFLTSAGKKLLGYAQHMLRMNIELEKDMRSLQESGTIRIGASVTVGAYVLPRLVVIFKNTNSMTRVEVVEDNTRQIEQLILTDRLDFGIVEGDTSSSDIINKPFMNDELTLICSPSHRFAKMNAVEPAELEREDFIIRENGSGTRKTFEEVMTGHGLSWNVIWTCNNADSIRTAVAYNIGITVISRLAVAQDIAAGRLCAPTVMGLEFKRAFKIIYHKNKFLTVPMQNFIKLCIDSMYLK